MKLQSIAVNGIAEDDLRKRLRAQGLLTSRGDDYGPPGIPCNFGFADALLSKLEQAQARIAELEKAAGVAPTGTTVPVLDDAMRQRIDERYTEYVAEMQPQLDALQASSRRTQRKDEP